MRECNVRKLAVLVLIGAAVAFLVKRLRGDPAPQFSNHPTVTGGPVSSAASPPDPLLQPEPVAVPAPDDPTVPASDRDGDLVPAPEDPTVAQRKAGSPAAEPEPATWADPVDGACPEGYPIKAKVKSGIFHVPGGVAYERTSPDRCYPTAAAAEADGLRAAKR